MGEQLDQAAFLSDRLAQERERYGWNVREAKERQRLARINAANIARLEALLRRYQAISATK